MKNCLRCQSEMIENLELRTTDAMGISIGEKGILKGTLGKLSVAVCPKCGYVETYLVNTDKLKMLDTLIDGNKNE